MPDSTVDILIKTRAELAGAEAAARALESQIGKAKALGQDYAHLETQLHKAQAAVKQFKDAQPKDPGQTFASALKGHLEELIPGLSKATGMAAQLGSGGLGIMAAGFAAFGSAVGIASAGLHKFANAQADAARLGAAMAQAGVYSAESFKAMQKMASSMASSTGTSAGDWTQALTRLTQFGADPSNIQKYADAVKNLAGLMNGDIVGASHAVAKAMAGSYEEFGRLGIKVPETVTQLEKMNFLCQELAKKGGGQLEIMLKTINGQTATAAKSIGALVKGIGAWVAETGIYQAVMQQTALVFSYYAKAISKPIEPLDGLTNKTAQSAKSIADAAAQADKYKKSLEELEKNILKIKTATDLETAALSRKKQAQDALDDAVKANELEEVDWQLQHGKISDQQAIAKRAEIEGFYATKKANQEIQNDEAQKQIIDRNLLAKKREVEKIGAIVSQDRKEAAKWNAPLSKAERDSVSHVDTMIANDEATLEKLDKMRQRYGLTKNDSEFYPAEYKEILQGQNEEDVEKRLIMLRKRRATMRNGQSRVIPGAADRAEKYEKAKAAYEADMYTGTTQIDDLTSHQNTVKKAYGIQADTRNMRYDVDLHKAVGKEAADKTETAAQVIDNSLSRFGNVVDRFSSSVDRRFMALEQKLMGEATKNDTATRKLQSQNRTGGRDY